MKATIGKIDHPKFRDSERVPAGACREHWAHVFAQEAIRQEKPARAARWLKSIPRAHPLFAIAQSLMMQVEERRLNPKRAAMIGRNLLETERWDGRTAARTATDLLCAGQPTLALEVLALKEVKMGLDADDRYDRACANCRVGKLEAARIEVIDLLERAEEVPEHVIMDGDLEAMWRAMEHPTLREAHLVMDVTFDHTNDVRRGPADWNTSDAARLPRALRRLLVPSPTAGDASWRVSDVAALLHPREARELRDRWEAVVETRLGLFARVRAAALQRILDEQEAYAWEALDAGNPLAARYHLRFLLEHRPEELKKLAVDPAFNEFNDGLIRTLPSALAENPYAFCEPTTGSEPDYADALRAAENPGGVQPAVLLARYGGICKGAKEYERALALMLELRRRWPGDAGGHGGVIAALIELGRWEEAEIAFAAAPVWYQRSPIGRVDGERIQTRNSALRPWPAGAFRGQPDLGGVWEGHSSIL